MSTSGFSRNGQCASGRCDGGSIIAASSSSPRSSRAMTASRFSTASSLSRHALAQHPAGEGLAVLPGAVFPLRRQWHLVWRHDRALSLPARTLLDDLRARLHVTARPRG
jgi:DNA-binding transcriptional LysR family regulator